MHTSCMGSPLPIVHAEWSLVFGIFGSCFQLMTMIMIIIANFVLVFVGIPCYFFTTHNLLTATWSVRFSLLSVRRMNWSCGAGLSYKLYNSSFSIVIIKNAVEL